MTLHPNAKTTPHQRRLLVERVQLGWAMEDACQAVGISVRTGYRWLRRFRDGEKNCPASLRSPAHPLVLG